MHPRFLHDRPTILLSMSIERCVCLRTRRRKCDCNFTFFATVFGAWHWRTFSGENSGGCCDFCCSELLFVSPGGIIMNIRILLVSIANWNTSRASLMKSNGIVKHRAKEREIQALARMDVVYIAQKGRIHWALLNRKQSAYFCKHCAHFCFNIQI